MKKVSFLGLGAMGARMAARLIAASYTVTVYNRSAEKAAALAKQGAQVAESPKQAAEASEIVISMVTDDLASRELWCKPNSGALAGLGADSLVLASSTLSQQWVVELAEKVNTAGAAFIDAPVVGTLPHAEQGQLLYLLGAEADDVAIVGELLSHLSQKQLHVGPVGHGAVYKLAINALFAGQVALLAEILHSLKNQGIATGEAMEQLAQTPVLSPVAQGAGQLMAVEKFAPMFPVRLVRKDLQYAQDMARATGLVAPVLESIGQIYQQAQESGFGELNITGVWKNYSSE